MALAAFAALPRVLVAVDFDGTLAPLVDDPMKARAMPGALEALRAAAALDGVAVAIVSGRDLATLTALTGQRPDDAIRLIGSHGAQAGQEGEAGHVGHGDHDIAQSVGTAGRPDADASADLLNGDGTALLQKVGEGLEAVRSRYPAVRLEYKPAAVALHTRGLEPSVAVAASRAARELGERLPGVHVMPGKDVVELTVVESNKGSALLDLARATGSDATLYLGDDVTDERAFAALDPAAGNLTVKVGHGDTVATQRVSGPEAVVDLLELFVRQRRDNRQRLPR